MVRYNIIVSVKGPSGGYEMPKWKSTKVKLNQIVNAIDGDKIYNGCALGLDQCNASKPCPIHFQIKAVRDDLKEVLRSTSVFEMTTGVEEGKAFLTR